MRGHNFDGLHVSLLEATFETVAILASVLAEPPTPSAQQK